MLIVAKNILRSKKSIRHIAFFILLVILWISCAESGDSLQINTDSEISLGQYLFFDKDLSYDHSISCSTCHNPNIVFTDGYKKSFNSKADNLLWNTPSILNIDGKAFFSWIDFNLNSLEKQMKRPLMGTHPIEMGFQLDSTNIIAHLSKKYNTKLSLESIIDNIASYISQLKSRDSKYDRSLTHSVSLLDQEKKGLSLFNQYCIQCHGGLDFNSPIDNHHFAYSIIDTTDHNIGLESITRLKDDRFKFRIPGLRNIALTSPYFHNGSNDKLYNAIQLHNNPKLYNKDNRYNQQKLNIEEINDIIHFLYTLTDTSYTQNIRFKDPFYDSI